MNCRGDDDVDAKRSRPSIGKTRKVPREERARAFGRDSISESHQGQRPQRLHSKAGYMAAPERFAENVRFSLHCGRRPYMALNGRAGSQQVCPLLKVDRPCHCATVTSQFDLACVKTHTSAKCKKYNSPARRCAARPQHDLTLTTRNSSEIFYARGGRLSFYTTKTLSGP